MTENNSNGIDLLLQQENSELRERVEFLEQKNRHLVDEVSCVKSAIADCLRRINTLETQITNKANSPKSASSITRKNPVPTLPSATFKKSVGPPKVMGSGKSNRSGRNTPLTTPSIDNNTGRDGTFMKDDGLLRTFLRGKPLTFYAPSELCETYDMLTEGSAPDEKLRMEWVYGYRGKDCRNNLHFLPTGECLYFVAAIVILFNIDEQTQRHYCGHTDDVKCVAVHPDRITIASGQTAGHEKKHGKPHVRIWNSVNLNTLYVMGLGEFERSICCLAFSKADGGDLIAVIDDANEHNISLWEWQKQRKITETKSSNEPVVAVEFDPLSNENLVSCGKGSLLFWTLEKSQNLVKRSGLFEKYEKPKFVLCLTFFENGDLITGDSSGNIYRWERGTNKIIEFKSGLHEGAIFSLCITKDGRMLSGGSKDRKIVEWDASLCPTGRVFVIEELVGSVRTITMGAGDAILVGTTLNCILQGNLSLGFSTIVGGGHTDEVWSLTSLPPTCENSSLQFLTASYDRRVVLWDALTHQAIWTKELTDAPHCADFYPLGSQLVCIGSRTARWFVLDIFAKEISAVHTDGSEQIECVKYSPDGRFLALGSRDNGIYVYACLEEGRKYSRIGKCTGHTSFVTHLDWSTDSQFLRSNSGDYELLFWSANNCRQVAASMQLRDVEWASQNCVLSFEVAGIWPEGADGTDINAVSRAHRKALLASADDFGYVKLFKYPASQLKMNHHRYTGHSSHVTNLLFLSDDSRLLSTGGKDTAIIQWEIM